MDGIDHPVTYTVDRWVALLINRAWLDGSKQIHVISVSQHQTRNSQTEQVMT